MEHVGARELFDAVVVLITATVYAIVGHRLVSRPVAPHARTAARMFAMWWYALGLFTLMRLVQAIVFHAGVTELVPHMVILFSSLVVVFMAIWGLVYYLLFIYTGDERLLPATLAFYVALYVWTVYYLVQSAPTGVVMEGHEVLVRYRHPLEGPVPRVLVALLVGIPLFSAAAYASLLFRVQDRTQRYRISMVSTMFLVWLGTALVQGLLIGTSTYGDFVNRVIAMLASVGVLAGFFPPRWVQERYGVGTALQVPERVAPHEGRHDPLG